MTKKGVIMFKHILVPTDGSPLSQDAVRRVIPIAKENGARITALYVKAPATEYSWAKGAWVHLPDPTQVDEHAEREAQGILGFVEDLCQKAGVVCTKITRTSNAVYEAIIEAATQSECDLIFMASHGRRGINALVLGSETHKVLTHSKIPVLVYR
jgi:nucleotide-binding universal stress UspA family protein